MQQRVAFIGLGIMGLPMAGHLLAAGYAVTVHTRSKTKADTLLAKGATWAASPNEAAQNAKVIFTCLPDTPDVKRVLLGEDGVIESARPGTVVIDHSTISPTVTRQMAEDLAKKQVTLLDAPVSGGDVGAINATLSIMVGGEKASFDSVTPLLHKLGKTITYCGHSGSGQLTKLVNQILVLSTLLGVSEALAFAKRGGLDLNTTLQAVGAGAARSWQLEQLGPKIAAGDFAPGFMIDLAQKDLRLVLEFVDQAKLALPGTSLVHQLYNTVQQMGHGREGTQALFKAIERLNP